MSYSRHPEHGDRDPVGCLVADQLAVRASRLARRDGGRVGLRLQLRDVRSGGWEPCPRRREFCDRQPYRPPHSSSVDALGQGAVAPDHFNAKAAA